MNRAVHNIYTVVKKEVKEFQRDKVTVAISILIGVVSIIIFGFIGSEPIENMEVVLYDGDGSTYASDVIDAFKASKTFSIVKEVKSQDRAWKLVMDGEVFGAIIIPKGFGDRISSGKKANMEIITDGSEPMISDQLLAAGLAALMDASSDLAVDILEETIEDLVDAEDMINAMQNDAYQMEKGLLSVQDAMETVHKVTIGMKRFTGTGKGGIKLMSEGLNDIGDGLRETNKGLTVMRENFDDVIEVLGDTRDDLKQVSLTLMLNPSVPPQDKLKIHDAWEVVRAVADGLEDTDDSIEDLQKGLYKTSNVLIEMGEGTEDFAEYMAKSSSTMEKTSKGLETMSEYMEEMNDGVTRANQKITGAVSGMKDYVGTDPEKKAKPLDVEETAVYAEGLVYSDFAGSGIFILAILLVCILLTSQSVVKERTGNTFELVMTTPVTPTQFIAGKILANFCIMFIGIVLAVIVSFGIMGMAIRGSVLLVLLFASIFIVMNLGIGLLISIISKTGAQAIQILLFYVFPGIILGGMFWPVRAFADTVQTAAWLIPPTYEFYLMRSVIIRGFGLAQLYIPLLIYMGFVAAVLIACIKVFKRQIG